MAAMPAEMKEVLKKKMAQTYRKGESVEWRFGGWTSRGRIVEVFTRPVARSLEGHEIVRNADAENPAYLIEQDDESRVMKSHCELSGLR
ncbi:DUF2945 domain-containing protein [Afifella marina]|uniref:Hypervirulence associated protein TUDOR domain-containing protein n=1 Tax=Afifella marina DSM 2698 TaxID=1120955 RepID=A0A1G5N563_AFIMA|nr:DUF2945 domain-containing protein [Afifella marina]SCZ32567.1 Protein of unknown function [Afifella marina DSM 2698]